MSALSEQKMCLSTRQ